MRNLGVAREEPRDLHQLPLGDRQLPGGCRRIDVAEPYELQIGFDALREGRGGPDRILRSAAQADILRDGQRGNDAELLGDIGDAGLQGLGWAAQTSWSAVDLDLASVRMLEAGENLHERALACAVLPEQRHDLAAPKSEFHALQRRNGSVAFR